jgi:Uncharacterised nucleotidyltransferase
MTPVPPFHVLATGRRLRVDAWTAEVIGAMRERDIRAVLLKGPAVVRWLYPEDPDQRPYTDADLIVSPADTGPARLLLGELGFVALPSPPLDTHALHALPYERESDGANVDLHRTLHGLQDVPCERAWQVVSTANEVIRVGNLDVEIPGIPVRILHLVLNLGHEDHPGTHAWRDLERGLSRSAPEEWRAAVALARELGVENELALRLRRIPEGTQLADRLGLTRRGSRYYRLRAAFESGHAPASVHSIWALKALPDTRSRVAYVRGKLLPGREALRERSALARGGHTGVAGALHVARVLSQLPRTLVAWARHYRE